MTPQEEKEWHDGYNKAVEHALTKIGQLSADKRGNIKRWAALEAINELKN